MLPGLDQFLGASTSKQGAVLVGNSGNLYDAEDGSIMLLDDESSTVPYMGPPLVNPFGVLLGK